MPGMEIKNGIFGASITDSIVNFNRVRCMPLLYFDETIVLKSAKGPKPLPTTSIMDGGRDSNLLRFQYFTYSMIICNGRSIARLYMQAAWSAVGIPWLSG